jgi:hypothetical protein
VLFSKQALEALKNSLNFQEAHLKEYSDLCFCKGFVKLKKKVSKIVQRVQKWKGSYLKKLVKLHDSWSSIKNFIYYYRFVIFPWSLNMHFNQAFGFSCYIFFLMNVVLSALVHSRVPSAFVFVNEWCSLCVYLYECVFCLSVIKKFFNNFFFHSPCFYNTHTHTSTFQML